MASWQGEIQHQNGRSKGYGLRPSLPQNPAVIKNGEIYAKDKNIVSGDSDQHDHLARV
jgi:hypothetical protein